MSTTEKISSAYLKMRHQTARAANGEEIRLAWVRALEEESGITFDAERGKRDLSYNNVVIEFKDLGKFNGRTTIPAFREATQERLLPYILRAAAHDNIDESDYIGIAIDGNHLVFAQVVDGAIRPQHLLPVTPVTFGMVVEACRKCFRRAITASNLVEDFGHASARGLALMRAMVEALSHALRPRRKQENLHAV
jgi:hypothetical protein